MPRFNDRFLRACRREPTDVTPVWFMRQAGRCLPEYRKLRERYSFMELCLEPELAAQVTLLPLRRFSVDAAILFADLTTPFLGMNVDFALKESVGPVIAEPIRGRGDVARLKMLHPEEDLGFVLEAIRLLRAELSVPLIGFLGSPFSLACYLIEGRGSRDFPKTRALMFRDPSTWHILMSLLTVSLCRYAAAQVRAGAQAIQVFDSWVGILGPDEYRSFVAPYVREIFDTLAQTGVPAIHFGTGTAGLLESMQAAGGDVIGVDWRVPLDDAWRRLGSSVAVQGNLEPAVLLAPYDEVARRAAIVLDQADGRPGHIFNLGHGILPDTSADTVARLTDFVHLRRQQVCA
ncbi:MAG: uroporphyrinogen decarboxylase [Chloroflexi bacterium]|nr:uroporphyrinogen decarboxylase [Chloroflexota bacterium]